MKNKLSLILSACLTLAALCFTGCNDHVIPEMTESATHPFTLTVTQAAPEGSTRVALEADGLSTYWEPGDKLALIDKRRNLPPIFLTTTLQEHAKTASFVAETGVPAGDYYVVYNYNDKLVYGHTKSLTIDDINKDDKLVLWGEINITEGVDNASISLQHLYAKVKIELKNFPTTYVAQVGMYSTQKGFPRFKLFSNQGLVDADYGYINSNGMENEGYYPSDNKQLNVRLYDGMYTNSNSSIESLSTLILPTDLRGEKVLFYVLDGETCYEFVKEDIKFTAGTSYKVVLDYKDCLHESRLKQDPSDYSHILITSTAEWRHLSYKAGRFTAKLQADLDFANDICIPLNVAILKGNGHTISNTKIDMPNVNHVGLLRYESINPIEPGISPEIREYQDNEVSNLTVENIHVTGKNYVGAISGSNAKVTKCKLIGKSQVTGTGDYVGGIVGCNYSDYNFKYPLHSVYVGENCTINGKNMVGGILGGFTGARQYAEMRIEGNVLFMEDCISKAAVNASGDYVGGIFGRIGGGNYDNSLPVNFTQEDYTLSFSKCINEGTVSGKNYVGGIGGELALRSNNCSPIDRILLKQSYSNSHVVGDNIVGGLLGRSFISVNTCYTRGTVTAHQDFAGGVVGELNYGINVTNSYSLVELTKPLSNDKSIAGGIVGKTGQATIKNCYFAGMNPTECGIVGESFGNTNVHNCLTTLSSLGHNLGSHFNGETDEYGKPKDWADSIENSHSGVTSIKEMKAVINGDNAYSDQYWPLEINPAYCLKFADFSIDTDIPNFEEEVM